MTPPPYVDAMPLHTITEVYGEEGLRERFVREIATFSDREQEILHRALKLASRLHAGERRNREPYLNHVLRVAIRCRHYFGISDCATLVAALLHDSVENAAEKLAGGAPVDPREAAFGVLARDFGLRASQLVRAVTNPVFDPTRDPDPQYLVELVQRGDTPLSDTARDHVLAQLNTAISRLRAILQVGTERHVNISHGGTDTPAAPAGATDR